MRASTFLWIPILLLFIVAFMPLEIKPVKAAWLEGWQYRKAINIVGSAGAGYDYPVYVYVRRDSGTDNPPTVYLAGKCRSDFGDIRFADANGNVFPYCITSQTTDDAHFWFKVTTLDLSVNRTVYLYYGNPNATYVGSLESVFIFAEPCAESSVNWERWICEEGSSSAVSVNPNNYIQIATKSGVYARIRNKNAFSLPSQWIWESFSATPYVPLLNRNITYYYYISSGVTSHSTCNLHWGSFTYYSSVFITTISPLVRLGIGSTVDADISKSGNYHYTSKFLVYKLNNVIHLYFDGSYVSNKTNNDDIKYLYFYGIYDGSSYVYFRLYAFKIRKFVYPEPYIASFGGEGMGSVNVHVGVSPTSLGAVAFKLNGVTYYTPKDFTIDSESGTQTLVVQQASIVFNASYHVGFSYWLKNGAWYSNDLTITFEPTENANFTMVYEAIRFNITANGISGISISVGGSTLQTPCLVWRGKGYTSFQVLTLSKAYNSTFSWYYVGVSVNGSFYSSQSEFTVYALGNTDIFLNYELVFVPPEPPPVVVPYESNEVTWFFRSDTHTVNDQLGYVLSEENSLSYAEYSRSVSANLSVSVGFRAWLHTNIGSFEITPDVVGIYTVTSNGAYEVNSTWSYAGTNLLVDAVEIRIYIRFGEGDWVEACVGITDDDLNIRLPNSTWIIYYNLIKEGNESYTLATLRWGSSTYDTRITLYTSRASPWDIALTHIVNLDFAGFLTAPFTYHIGDLFYALIVLFLCVTAYNDTGSLGYVIAILWLFGGAGSILAALLPSITLNIAYILLAFATAFTLLKFILK